MQLILSPACGWEDLPASKSEGMSVQDYLVPMFAVAGAAQLCQALYHSDVDMVLVVLRGIIVFVSLFAGWQIASLCYKYSLGRTIPSESAAKVPDVVAYGMTLMSLAYTLPPLLPVGLGLSVILPICAALIVCKSIDYLIVPRSREGMYLLLVFGSMYLPPFLIQQLTQLIII